MKSVKATTVLALSLLLVLPLWASSHLRPQQQGQDSSILIVGKIMDKAAASRGGSLIIRIDKFFSTGFPLNFDRRVYEGTYLANDTFVHRYNKAGEWHFMTVQYRPPAEDGLNLRNAFYRTNRYFLLKPDDRIDMEVYPDSIWFSGKGSKRLNVQVQLMKIEEHCFTNRPSMNAANYRSVLTSKIGLFRTIADRQMKYLRSVKSLLTDEEYGILLSDIFGRRNLNFINEINGLLSSAWPADIEQKRLFNKDIFNLYNQHKGAFNIPLKDGYHAAPYLMDFLFEKELLEYGMATYTETQTRRKLENSEELYDLLSRKFSGTIKQRLLLIGATYLLGRPGVDIADYFNRIEPQIQFPLYKDMVEEQVRAHRAHAKVFDFDLPDASGNRVRLSDFKGSMVVVDFWFTGCPACKRLKEQMEPIVERYKRANVVFVSISIDRDRDKWLNKGIPSGDYTHEASVNLFTEGMGWEHPVMKYYSFTAVPQILIIDKAGRLISSTPPRPDSQKNRQWWMNLIDANL